MRRQNHTQIVAIGSPHGDDQAGWLCGAALAAMVDKSVSVATVVKPLDLIDCLDRGDHLVLIDACVTGDPPGTLHEWEWPLQTIPESRPSTHGFGVDRVLQLASVISRLPRRVTVFGVEIDPQRTCGEPSQLVVAAAESLVGIIIARLKSEPQSATVLSFPVAPSQEIRP